MRKSDTKLINLLRQAIEANIALPEQIADTIEQLADENNISRFIEDAVMYYMEHTGKTTLREQVKQGALKRAERDLKLSHEWNSLGDYETMVFAPPTK